MSDIDLLDKFKAMNEVKHTVYIEYFQPQRKEGGFYRGDAWISNTIDWEYSSNLSLMSILSYVVHSTKETGNINTLF